MHRDHWGIVQSLQSLDFYHCYLSSMYAASSGAINFKKFLLSITYAKTPKEMKSVKHRISFFLLYQQGLKEWSLLTVAIHSQTT